MTSASVAYTLISWLRNSYGHPGTNRYVYASMFCFRNHSFVLDCYSPRCARRNWEILKQSGLMVCARIWRPNASRRGPAYRDEPRVPGCSIVEAVNIAPLASPRKCDKLTQAHTTHLPIDLLSVVMNLAENESVCAHSLGISFISMKPVGQTRLPRSVDHCLKMYPNLTFVNKDFHL